MQTKKWLLGKVKKYSLLYNIVEGELQIHIYLRRRTELNLLK